MAGMGFNVLVAERHNDKWGPILAGVRRRRPDASALRVMDGEQALRFLFERGLLVDEPETPDLIVLAAELPLVPTSIVLSRIRQDPRTCAVPVIVVGDLERYDMEGVHESQQWLHRHPGVVVILGELKRELEKQVADAMRQLFVTPPPSAKDTLPEGPQTL